MSFQDLVLSARVLRREKSFFLVSVFVLALGICGVTTQFSLIDAFLLRGLPVPEPERLVSLSVRDPSWPAARSRAPFTADFLEWSRRQASCEALAEYYTNGSFIVVNGGRAERFAGSHVTPSFFPLLRVRPALGRDFTEADNRPLGQAPRVAIISDALWASEFGRDPGILGRTLRIDGAEATVIGVMPADFRFSRDQLWIPLFNEYAPGPRPNGGAAVIARLRPGVSAAQAAAELSTLARALARDYPLTNANLTEVRVEPLIGRFVDPFTRRLLLSMLAAVLVVLAIASVNVTNLQLARAHARSRELAVRAALGASRLRLLTPLLADALIVMAAAGAAGILLSCWTVSLMGEVAARANGVLRLPAWVHFRLNGEVLAFTLAVGGASVLLSGLLPAWIASRSRPLEALKEGGAGNSGGGHRLAGSLVVGQIALTSALLAVSLLLIRSIVAEQRQTLGYDGARILTARVNLEGSNYRQDGSLAPLYGRILQQLRSSPALETAALTSRSNLLSFETAPLELPGRSAEPGREPPTVIVDFVSEGYFGALGLRPASGRDFTAADSDPQHPVALVNASFALKYFGRSDPVGQRLRLWPGRDQVEPIVAGVVPDTLVQGPLDDQSDGAGVFLPLRAFPHPYVTLVARGRAAAAGLFEPLRREMAKVDPTIAVYAPSSPPAAFDQALFVPRALAATFTFFAGAAVILAAVGLYGLAALAVGRRRREFGIRMALGATPRAIGRIVLGQGTRQFAAGAALGLAGTLALVRLVGASLEPFLFRVSPRDPLIYLAVTGVLAATALLACLLPARRAARVDPLAALRAE